MDDLDTARRLAALESLMRAVLAALAPPEEEGSGFDDLVETLADLTVSVAEVTHHVRRLHCNGCARSPLQKDASSAVG